VISVGNLRVGGTGKTPMVEYIARLLLENGERPAILIRGYARQMPADGATVVADGTAICVGVDGAGDEALMLARAVRGAIVVVGANRYLSGRLAERQLGATVHILDDGFQHLELAREVDLLLVSEEDLGDRPLPAGRLRESVAAASAADAAIVDAGYLSAAERVGRALGLQTVFFVTRVLGPPRMVANHDTVVVPSGAAVFAVAGVARPERFFADIEAAGWRVVGTMPFGDHSRFGARDIRRITAAAKSTAAAIVLTTDKDAVRLVACDLGDLPIASVPLTATVEPADRFRDWLLDRIRERRTQHPEPSTLNLEP